MEKRRELKSFSHVGITVDYRNKRISFDDEERSKERPLWARTILKTFGKSFVIVGLSVFLLFICLQYIERENAFYNLGEGKRLGLEMSLFSMGRTSVYTGSDELLILIKYCFGMALLIYGTLYLYEGKGRTRPSVFWRPIYMMNITRGERVIYTPIFHNTSLLYEATGDFNKYLEKIRIKEYNVREINNGRGIKKRNPRAGGFWRGSFTFSKVPKKGRLLIKWR